MNTALELSQVLLEQGGLAQSSIWRGSPTYTKITSRVSTTTVFGLCTCKWGIFALVWDLLQSQQHKFHVTRFFLSPKAGTLSSCKQKHVSIRDIPCYLYITEFEFDYMPQKCLPYSREQKHISISDIYWLLKSSRNKKDLNDVRAALFLVFFAAGS